MLDFHFLFFFFANSFANLIQKWVSNLQVDHDDPEEHSLLRFNSIQEAYYRHDSLLVFSIGRSPTSYKMLRSEKRLLTHDIAVISVGTEIAYGEGLVVDDGWLECLNHKWDRDVVVEETAKFPELVPQSEIDQQPHKVSFYVKDNVPKLMEVLSERLEKRGMVTLFVTMFLGSFRIRNSTRGEGTKFLRYRIQFLERSIRKLDFNSGVICTIFEVNDLKNAPELENSKLLLASN